MSARSDDAPPVFQPPAGNPRFPLFESLRAIAVLLILMVHAGLFTGAMENPIYGRFLARLDVSLAAFFVISGFLLYRPYVADRLGGGRAPTLSTYGRNRVLRIVPAYWVALTALAIVIGLGGFWTAHTWTYYAFVQELDRNWAAGGIIPAWSLTVEVSFYICLPGIAWLMARLARGRGRRAQIRNEVALVMALYAITIAYRVIVRAAIGDDPTSNLWALLPASLDWFALGMGLAAASAALHGSARPPAAVRVVERRPGVAWLAAGALFVLTAVGIGVDGAFDSTTPAQWITLHLVYGLIGLLVVLPAAFGGDRRAGVRRLLAWRPLAWLGLVSYGLFLYHHPILLALSDSPLADVWDAAPMLGLTIVGALVAIACAALSYYVVERPFLRLKRTRRDEPGVPDASPPPPVPASAAS